MSVIMPAPSLLDVDHGLENLVAQRMMHALASKPR
jgi:hypothetical protein